MWVIKNKKMKFNVKLEPVEILDEELLEMINNVREFVKLPLYNLISEVPTEEIEDWIKHNKDYFYTELLEYSLDIDLIEIID